MSEIVNTTPHEELIRFVDDANDKMWQYRGVPDFDPSALLKETLEKAEKANYPLGVGRVRLNTAMGAFIFYNDAPLALSVLNEALEIFKSIDNKKWAANTYSILGIINNSIGDKETALYNALRAIDFYDQNPEELKDRTMVYYIIGTIYKDLKKNEEAEKYYLKGVASDPIENGSWGGRVYAGLANVYTEFKKYEEALKYSFISLEKLKGESNNIGESRALTDIGVIYKRQGDYETALKYMKEGLAIRQERKLKQFEITSHMEIATLYCEINKQKDAILHLEEAEKLAIEINQLSKLSVIYKNLSSTHKFLNDHSKALSYSERLLELSSELHRKETEERISKLQNSLLIEKETELERIRNVELKNAYELITEKNKEIMDSIQYAKRIQTSLLTTEKYIDKNLKRLNNRDEN